MLTIEAQVQRSAACWLLVCLVVCLSPAHASEACPLSEERAIKEAVIDAERKREAAYENLRLKEAANTAAMAELAENPEARGSALSAQQAAVLLKQAREEVEKSDDAAKDAHSTYDCLLRRKGWKWSVGVPVRVSGGAGGAALWGAGARWSLMSSAHSQHQLELSYLQLTNLDFDEARNRRSGSALSFGSLGYAYGFERIRTGLGLATRLSTEPLDPSRRLWLTGRVAAEFGARTSKVCNRWCFIGTGSVLLESWIPLDGVTPLSLLVGAELQLGVGDGPID
jgi:hypothetical protein